jgi:hypothetical protein
MRGGCCMSVRVPSSLPNCAALTRRRTRRISWPLMELAIGEVEADAQRDQRALQTMDAPSMACPPDTELGREPETVHSRDFAPGSSTELVIKPEAAEYCEDPRPNRIGRRPW